MEILNRKYLGTKALLSGDLPSSNGALYAPIAFQFQASKTPEIPIYILDKLLKHYRDYRKDGMSSGWIVNEMKAKRIALTDGAYTLSDMQIAAFVAALSRIEAGNPPTNPNESPSWSESYDMGLGQYFPSSANLAKYVPLLIGGALALAVLPGALGRYQRGRG